MPGRQAADAPAAKWRKSSRSTANGACVEVAAVDRAIAVRDTKDPDGPRLGFAAHQWAAFVTRVKGSEYDL